MAEVVPMSDETTGVVESDDVVPSTNVDQDALKEGLSTGFDLMGNEPEPPETEDPETEDMVVNDSLGTIDPSDSTGTDLDKVVEAEKTAREMDKLRA
jgi:hypothetical protein